MSALTFYKMLSYIYAFLLGALQRVSLYHQVILHCIRKAEAEGIGQLIVVDSASDTDSMQESISIREMKDGEDDNGEFEDQDEDQDRSEIDGFSIGTNTPGSTPAQAGRKQMFAPDGGALTSPRTSYVGSVQSPPVRGFAAMYLEEDEEGHLSAGAVTQLLRQLETESEEILFAVADLAHTRCAKLMGMRSEQSSKLLPAEIYRLLGLTWSFILQSELLSGYMCYGLRTAILSQVWRHNRRLKEEWRSLFASSHTNRPPCMYLHSTHGISPRHSCYSFMLKRRASLQLRSVRTNGLQCQYHGLLKQQWMKLSPSQHSAYMRLAIGTLQWHSTSFVCPLHHHHRQMEWTTKIAISHHA
jgi:hypothetical protein